MWNSYEQYRQQNANRFRMKGQDWVELQQLTQQLGHLQLHRNTSMPQPTPETEMDCELNETCDMTSQAQVDLDPVCFQNTPNKHRRHLTQQTPTNVPTSGQHMCQTETDELEEPQVQPIAKVGKYIILNELSTIQQKVQQKNISHVHMDGIQSLLDECAEVLDHI